MSIMYKKFQPCDYIMLIKGGKVVKQGMGLTVLCDNMRTNILAVPATAFDGAFAFDDIVTADYQTVCVQGAITYMITDFEQATGMADFGYERNYKEKQVTAMNLLCKRISNVLKAIVIREVCKRDVRQIIKLADEMAGIIMNALKDDEVIRKLGVEVLTVNVLGVGTKPETRKALEAAAREQILKEQDDAIYMRRNAAIEQERLIKENELETEIKVAEKEKEKQDKKQEIKRRLIQTELEMDEMKQNGKYELEKKEMEAKIEIDRKNMEANIENDRRNIEARIELDNKNMQAKINLEEQNKAFVELEVENERKKADVEAYAVEKLMKAYENVNVALIEALAMTKMDPGTLMAKAFKDMGTNAGKIGVLNITPDLLETIVNK